MNLCTLVQNRQQRTVRMIEYIVIGVCCVYSTTDVLDAQSAKQDISKGRIYADREIVGKVNALQEGNSLEIKRSYRIRNEEIGGVIPRIIKESGLSLGWSRTQVPMHGKVTLINDSLTILEALQDILAGRNAFAKISSDGQTILIYKLTDSMSTSNSRDTSQVNVGTIVGKIVDSATGEGIARVSVLVSGSKKNGAVSNNDGIFRIQNVVVGRQTVQARVIGYKNSTLYVEVEKGKSVNVDIKMIASASPLQQVVTTATGKQRRSEVPHDIAKINVDEILKRAPITSVTDIIAAAQIPGVQVSKASGDPGAATKIRIRGLGSITKTNDPVVMVDGVWLKSEGGTLAGIDDIDPATIESIEIVKGPSASTLYGQDAANGVIIVTTKKGQIGPTRWGINSSRQWGKTYGSMPLEYVGLGHGLLSEAVVACNVFKVVQRACIQDSVLILDPNNPLVRREGVATSNSTSLRMDGGSGNVTYGVTATSSDNVGVRETTPMDGIRLGQFGLRLGPGFGNPSSLKSKILSSTVNVNPRDNISIGIQSAFTSSNLLDNKYTISTETHNIFSDPVVLNSYGKYNTDTLIVSDIDPGKITRNKNLEKKTSIRAGGQISYYPSWGGNVNGNIGFEVANRSDRKQRLETWCTSSNSCKDTVNVGELGSNSAITSTFDLKSTLPTIGERLSRIIKVTPSLGISIRRSTTDITSIDNIEMFPGIGDISGNPQFGSRRSLENVTGGWFINGDTRIFDRVSFVLGLRQDAGSAIKSSSSPFYPKIGGSWLVSDESFWKQNQLFSEFRLRAALGHSAIQPDIFDIEGAYASGYTFINDVFVKNYNLSRIGNGSLDPERAIEVELGFDGRLFSNKLNLSTTYSRKNNVNSLVSRSLPPSLGGSSRKENIGKVVNTNYELSADLDVIDSRNLRAVINSTFTVSDNVVKRIGRNRDISTIANVIKEGFPIAGVWAKQVQGYGDINGDGLIELAEVTLSDSLVYLGWSQPRFSSGFGFNITANNTISLDSRFTVNAGFVQQYGRPNSYGSENVNSPLSDQAIAIQSLLSGKRSIDQLRWSSMSITYNIGNRMARAGVRNASLSLQGSNLGLWTNYTGRDPSVNSNGVSDVALDDGSVTPPPRMFSLKLSVGL